MPYLNNYKPDPPLERADWHAATPPEAYDLNFAFDLPPPSRLETEGVRLEPVIPSLHARQLFRLFSAYPDTLRYMPYGPFADFDSFLTFLEDRRRRSNCLMFVVYDLGLEFDHVQCAEEEAAEGARRLRPERIAGVVGLITTPDFRMAELGPLHLADPFQRTHVMTHSIWLLLDWIFASPSPSSGSGNSISIPGLGLRRAQWGAHASNLGSIEAAKRIGFTLETAHAAWERPLKSPTKAGRVDLPEFVRSDPGWYEREREIGYGRHSAMLGMSWEDWHGPGGGGGGAKERVRAMVRRGVVRRKASEVRNLPLEMLSSSARALLNDDKAHGLRAGGF